MDKPSAGLACGRPAVKPRTATGKSAYGRQPFIIGTRRKKRRTVSLYSCLYSVSHSEQKVKGKNKKKNIFLIICYLSYKLLYCNYTNRKGDYEQVWRP